ERDLCEARIAVRPAADRNRGEFFEAGQKVEIRSRVVVPPTALALAASALVAQTAEREAALDVGETVVHREGTLACVAHDRDLPGRSTQRHGQKDGDAQGGHCAGCSGESASQAHIVTTSDCTAAFELFLVVIEREPSANRRLLVVLSRDPSQLVDQAH